MRASKRRLPPALGRPRYTPGPRGLDALRKGASGEWFDCDSHAMRQTCLRLHDHGLLERDAKQSTRFRITPSGREAAGQIHTI